jgi:hypothetical protein
MDYKELLRKYMAHVLSCESIDFTDRLNDSTESEVVFTDEEVRELKELSAAV